MKPMRPLLSATIQVAELDTLDYPVLGFYKYDGIRALRVPALGLVSRRLKPIPNKAVQEKFKSCHWLDGELIVGDPTAEDCYHTTESQVLTQGASADGVFFYVFDSFKNPSDPYEARRREMELSALFMKAPDIRYVPYVVLRSAKEVMKFEAKAVRLGYEGIMLRRPAGIYKKGRSTLREQILMKLKRFEDFEAEIVGVYARKKNMNKLQKDERGYAKRSSHKANKVELEEVGGFVIRSLGDKKKSKCGTGVFTQEQRRALWKIRKQLPGKILKCRKQPAGEKDKPRFPRAMGFRSRIDF